MTQQPTIGRIVHYTITAYEAEQINRRRAEGATSVGNFATENDVYPMLITRVWSGTGVNGQVFLDGNDALWVTSVTEGTGPRTYAWPQRT